MYTMTRLKVYGLLAFAALLQMTVIGHVAIHHARPDLIFSLTVFFALFAHPRLAVEVGVVSGALKDVFSSDLFGLNILLLAFVAFVVSRIASRFYRESKLTQGLLTFACYFLASSAWFFFEAAANGGSAVASDCLPQYLEVIGLWAIPNGLYTSLVSVVSFGPLMRWFGLEERLSP